MCRTVLQSPKSFLWMLDYAWMDLLLSIFGTLWLRCHVQLTTVSNPTILASEKLVQDRTHKPRHQLTKENKRLINCLMWITHTQTHILLKVSLNCTFFEDNEAIINMIIKGRRHVFRTHRVALDWLFDSINFGTQDPNQICWHQKLTRRHAANQRKFFAWRMGQSYLSVQYQPFQLSLLRSEIQLDQLHQDRGEKVARTERRQLNQRSESNMLTTRWHSNQRKFFAWRMESSSSFVQHYEFLDVLLQPLQWFSFWSDRKAERHVKKRSRGDFRWRLNDGEAKDSGEGVESEKLFTEFGVSGQSGEFRWTKRSGKLHLATVCKQLQSQKSDILEGVENAIIAEGNLCVEQLQKQRDQRAPSNSNSSGQPVQVRLQDQSFKTWNTRTINT